MEILILNIHVSFLLLSMNEYKQEQTECFEAFAFFGILACVGNEYLFLLIDFFQTLYIWFISLKNACVEKSNNKILKLKIRMKNNQPSNSLRKNGNPNILITDNDQTKQSSNNISIITRKQIIPNNNYIQGFQSSFPVHINDQQNNFGKGSQNSLMINPFHAVFSNLPPNTNITVNYINRKNKLEKKPQKMLIQKMPSSNTDFLSLQNQINEPHMQNLSIINEIKSDEEFQNQRKVNPIYTNNFDSSNISRGQDLNNNEISKNIERKNIVTNLPGQVYQSNNFQASPFINNPRSQKNYNPWNKINDPFEIQKLNLSKYPSNNVQRKYF